ncbi:hypothetical protein HID58_029019 [Brassica napus]|uniref:Uncharacterized protein n=1 Tax=Brassica napus TaxID=3708 RepID=A0ABQ8CDG0_BRANA|nr:hypothetical protein HID58_029019 [Brassica napus]
MNSGRCSSVVEARLLRYWEANPAMLIQGSINVYHFNPFNEASVHEGIKTIYNEETQSTQRLMTITRRDTIGWPSIMSEKKKEAQEIPVKYKKTDGDKYILQTRDSFVSCMEIGKELMILIPGTRWFLLFSCKPIL